MNNNNNTFPSSRGGDRLIRYGSAPSSVLSTAIDSIISSAAAFPPPEEPSIALRTSNYTSPSSSSLVRHSSLPAGFHNDYPPDNGFSITRGRGLGTSSSFTHNSKESLSRISEQTENVSVRSAVKRSSHSDHTGACFTMGLWDENHPLTFSVSPTKLPNAVEDTMESQFQFGVPHEAALELATMDKLLNIPHDSVPCKIRAKRGFATHPRSIAERERRTRISGKLKKLQDLVPNMDKQTSYADMLDLAVQHIKTLQHEVQNLNHELDNCSCGCKNTTAS